MRQGYVISYIELGYTISGCHTSVPQILQLAPQQILLWETLFLSKEKKKRIVWYAKPDYCQTLAVCLALHVKSFIK